MLPPHWHSRPNDFRSKASSSLRLDARFCSCCGVKSGTSVLTIFCWPMKKLREDGLPQIPSTGHCTSWKNMAWWRICRAPVRTSCVRFETVQDPLCFLSVMDASRPRSAKTRPSNVQSMQRQRRLDFPLARALSKCKGFARNASRIARRHERLRTSPSTSTIDQIDQCIQRYKQQ